MSEALVNVKYIGPRDYWEGRLYNVKLRFDHGQTRAMPQDLALKFLTHKDTFERDDATVIKPKTAEQETAEAIEQAQQAEKDDIEKDHELYDVLARVDIMEKEQLAEFASRYGARLDKRKGLDAMRGEVRQLVNLRGVV
ncbi:MAG: hypothetical protein PWQ61_3394 [Betaproteobacteria bacterium]|nr:hypothetical protein [Betaproteobacteria bacterium]